MSENGYVQVGNHASIMRIAHSNGKNVCEKGIVRFRCLRPSRECSQELVG